MIKAIVAGWHESSQELLHRRVGGILKGIAEVSSCRVDEVTVQKAHLLITFAYSKSLKEVLKYDPTARVVGAKLTLLPVGVKILKALPKDAALGVIAQHQGCANYFYSEIIRACKMNNKFYIGTFEEMMDMPVQYFIVSEEMVESTREIEVDREKIISIPRFVCPFSAAEIIRAALEAASDIYSGNAYYTDQRIKC